MKLSILAASLLAGVALAAPGGDPPYGHKWGKGGKGKWGGRKFTSTYSVVATPKQVVNETESGEIVYTGGLPGAIGYYDFGINSDKEVICWDIKLYGFRGQYESAADTATHIHEEPKGGVGPPRLAFPNPKRTGKKDERRSVGCMKGPFETGVIDEATGLDTGAGFKLDEIEDKPKGFACDVHSSLAVPGAVRGQLS